jgi:hypothetical protein
MNYFIIWLYDLTPNPHRRGEIAKNKKFNILNWKFLEVLGVIAKVNFFYALWFR